MMLLDHGNVCIEKERRVERTTLGLRMELGADNVLMLVANSLIAVIVKIYKERLPIIMVKSRDIHSIAVILAGDMAAASGEVEGRNVVSTVAVLQLDGPGASRKSEELMSQADAHDGTIVGINQLAQVMNRILAVGWISWAVGDKDTIEMMSYLMHWVVKRKDGDACTAADKTTEDVFFNAAVNDCNV